MCYQDFSNVEVGDILFLKSSKGLSFTSKVREAMPIRAKVCQMARDNSFLILELTVKNEQFRTIFFDSFRKIDWENLKHDVPPEPL